MNQINCRAAPFLVMSWLAAASAGAADPVPAPSPGASLLGLVVPLLAVAFSLAALWWMLRRNNGRNGAAGPARIVQVIAVGPRERVVIIDHDTRRFMLGVTPTTVNVLADLDGENAAKNHAGASSNVIARVAENV